MVQLTFIEREEYTTPPAEAARIYLEDTWRSGCALSREAIRAEKRPDAGVAVIDYTDTVSKEPAHWRICSLLTAPAPSCRLYL